MSWSGYILNRNTDSGCYPKDIIHYFENDDFDIERLITHAGVFDIDDIILNVLGMSAVYVMVMDKHKNILKT